MEETTPLNTRADGSKGNGNGRLSSAPIDFGKWKETILAIALISGLIVGSVFLFRLPSNGNDASTTSASPTSKIRPICETFVANKVQILQTSLGEPSQQWSALECEQAAKKSWFSSKKAKVKSYGALDAVFQMGDPAHPNRPIMGFGGAFTEASAVNYGSLTEEGKNAVLELLFGKDGLGYSIGRVHINSCDFSVKSYSFDETDGDFELDDFDMNVSHDVDSGMIDMMRGARSLLSEAWGGEELQIYASPWSPPTWMKAPTPSDAEDALHAENMTGSAQPTCLREGVGPDSRYAKAWALYFSKFISAYKEQGVPLFAISIQNEPEFPAPWEACSYTPYTESDFLEYHLGPQLRETHPDVKILVFDHNKDHAPVWIQHLLAPNRTVSQYVSGTAIHWYAGGMDRLLDGAQGTPNMHRILEQLHDFGTSPDHLILGSEACHCPTTGYAGGDINVAWARAERYAHTILADLAAGSNGWVEWNLLLDSIGGPNHLKNLCDAPLLAAPHRAKGAAEAGVSPTLDFEHAGHPFGRVIGDGRTRAELNALGFPAKFLDVGVVVQPMYFYMGHISRHVRSGSFALTGLVEGGATATSGPTVFRPEGQVVAGGGINDLARTGIELTLWPCEGSTRQQFSLNGESQIEVSGHDWLGEPTKSCVGKKVDKDFLGLILGTCVLTENRAGVFDIVMDSGGKVTVELKNGKSEECLVVRELKNGGGAYGPRGGAQVSLGDCSSEKAKWFWNKETGEITSSFIGEDVCMTTGWPFLQMGAFQTPHGDRTVVILNEAAESANYVLKGTKEEPVVAGSIPPHSIQTVLIS